MPQLFLSLKQYNFRTFLSDLLSGIIVAIIALPLAIASVLPIGLTAQQGIIAAVIAGFANAILGGSKFQICGPTNTFVIIGIEIVITRGFGYGGFVSATVMAGIILLLAGLFRFGKAIRYFPYPITVGYTAGLATMLLLIQLKDFFGFSEITSAPSLITRLTEYVTDIGTIDVTTLLIGLLSLAIVLILPRISKKIPAAIVAVVITSAIVAIFELQVKTISSLSNDGGNMLPLFTFADWGTTLKLIPSAFSIALLCATESLLGTIATDTMTGSRSNANAELIAQGAANIIAPMLGGTPTAGALARSAANVRNGGKTPVSQIVHSTVLLMVFLVLMPLAKFIPLTCLAGILIVVAINMASVKIFAKMYKFTLYDKIIVTASYLLTIFVSLMMGILGALALAIVLYGKKLFKYTSIEEVPVTEEYLNVIGLKYDDDKVQKCCAIRIKGDFFFKNAFKFLDKAELLMQNKEILFLDFEEVKLMDSTALNILTKLLFALRLKHYDCYFVNCQHLDKYYHAELKNN